MLFLNFLMLTAAVLFLAAAFASLVALLFYPMVVWAVAAFMGMGVWSGVSAWLNGELQTFSSQEKDFNMFGVGWVMPGWQLWTTFGVWVIVLPLLWWWVGTGTKK